MRADSTWLSPAYLLVDLGGTRVRCAVGQNGRLLGRLEERTDHTESAAGTLGQIARMARHSLAESGMDLSSVERLVISSPGPLDPIAGIVYEAPNMPGWEEVHIADDLFKLLGVPVRAINDANAAAIGEFAFGAGRGHTHVVYLTISTGIGGGVVADGRLLEGTTGSAGELGHMTIDRHGPICNCGNVGCLEILASGTSIARRFLELLETGVQSSVRKTVKDRRPTAADISMAAAEGDPAAAALFRDAAEAVGIGVVNCIHIFNPEVVILGGGVTQAGALLFGPVREMVDRYAMRAPRCAVRVVPAELGDDAGLFGTLAQAIAESNLSHETRSSPSSIE